MATHLLITQKWKPRKTRHYVYNDVHVMLFIISFHYAYIIKGLVIPIFKGSQYVHRYFIIPRFASGYLGYLFIISVLVVVNRVLGRF